MADKAANFTRIDVDTTNRVVSLTGVVESPEQKARAQQIAMDVSGVRGVDNNLTDSENQLALKLFPRG